MTATLITGIAELVTNDSSWSAAGQAPDVARLGIVTDAANSVRNSSSVAPRVAATVVAIPPPSYAVPAIRAANSAARSPAKTR